MNPEIPLFTVIDTSLRALMIVFLLAFAIRFKNLITLVLLTISSYTLYTTFVLHQQETLARSLLSEIVAFLLVFIIYDWMRLKHLIKDANKTHTPILDVAFEKEGEAHIAVDIGGKIIFWSAGAERLYGYSSQEAVGKNIKIIIPTNEEFNKIQAEVLEGNIYQGNTVRIHKDGSEVPVEIYMYPLRDSNDTIIGATTSIHKIEEVKE